MLPAFHRLQDVVGQGVEILGQLDPAAQHSRPAAGLARRLVRRLDHRDDPAMRHDVQDGTVPNGAEEAAQVPPQPLHADPGG